MARVPTKLTLSDWAKIANIAGVVLTLLVATVSATWLISGWIQGIKEDQNDVLKVGLSTINAATDNAIQAIKSASNRKWFDMRECREEDGTYENETALPIELAVTARRKDANGCAVQIKIDNNLIIHNYDNQVSYS